MPTTINAAEVNGAAHREESVVDRAARCAAALKAAVVPFGDSAFALRDPSDEKAGEIHLPTRAQRNKQTATIVATGPRLEGMAVGDRVVLLGGYKVEVELCGWKLEIVSASDVGGIVLPGAEV